MKIKIEAARMSRNHDEISFRYKSYLFNLTWLKIYPKLSKEK